MEILICLKSKAVYRLFVNEMKVLITVVTNYFSTTRRPLGRIENPIIVRELTIDQRLPTISPL